MKSWLLNGFGMLFMTSAAYAYTGLGVCNYGKEVVPSVICYGTSVMKQTTVNGDIKVTGTLRAEGITVRNMIIQGDVELINSAVTGTVNAAGHFQADQVEFKKGVAVTGDNIILNNTKVNGLVTITSSLSTPYLQVQCGSVVTGSVLFDGKAGVVQITGDSLVQGKIVNGSMEFVKRKCAETSVGVGEVKF